MSTQKIYDYLTKQLSIENTVVTFRLLSREMEIHVNAAKQELERYRNDVNSYATYLISGLLPPKRPSRSQDDGMEVDGMDNWDDDYEGDDSVQEIQVLLVGEEHLEGSKSQFSKIHSVHVYSLSPAKLLDADLICPPTDKVRLIDSGERGPELALTCGKIIGPHVVQGKAINPRKSKALAAAVSSSKLKITPREDTKEKEKEKPKPSNKDLKGPSGKLDWSKAKSKEDVMKEKEVRQKGKQDQETAKKEKQKTEDPAPQRGLKRKSTAHIISDHEDVVPVIAPSRTAKKASFLSSSKGARVKKGIVLSEEDDDNPEPTKSKGKAKARGSEIEKSLRSMMDIDDDEVEKVSRVATKPDVHTEEEEDEEDEEMYEEPEPEVVKPKPRKKKEKKVVPVGKNGLKKKRIVKSRMTTDAKGYIATEDYSSYESVDEEEPDESDAPANKKKGGSKSKETKGNLKASSSSKELNKRSSTSGGTANSKAMEGPSRSGAGQKNLMNFFGKKP